MTRDLRVCVIGDSFVAGVGDPTHLGWVGRLAARTHRHIPITCYPLGVRRQTSRDVVARWHAECSARLPAGCDARVVVSVGVNDTTTEGRGIRVCAGESTANLAELVRGTRLAAWPALVVGPPPVADTGQNERIAQLDDEFTAACAETDVGYVSVVAPLLANPIWMREVAAGDGPTLRREDTGNWPTCSGVRGSLGWVESDGAKAAGALNGVCGDRRPAVPRAHPPGTMAA